MTTPSVQPAVPSLFNVRCPRCDSQDFLVEAIDLGGGALYGLLTLTVFRTSLSTISKMADAGASSEPEIFSLQLKCNNCKAHYSDRAHAASPDELLPSPCTVTFERVKAFQGALQMLYVFLNGVKVCGVKNGQTVTFSTPLRYNTIFVGGDPNLVVPRIRRFEAVSGGTFPIRW